MSEKEIIDNESENTEPVEAGKAEAKNGKKDSKKEKTVKKNKKPNVFSKLWKLLKDSASEMKKITWAGKLATTKNAILVIVVLIIFGVFLGLFDMGFNWLVTTITDLY